MQVYFTIFQVKQPVHRTVKTTLGKVSLGVSLQNQVGPCPVPIAHQAQLPLG